MKKIKACSAKKIAEILEGILLGEDKIIDKISLNSKEKDSNWCFVAIKGKKFDGNDFIYEAINNGASLIITDSEINVKASVIYVANTIKALGKIAKMNIGETKIVAVTGSVGKTTTKEMIISVLKENYKVIGTNENENNEIGVPLTLLSIKNHDICVLEMGMRSRGEIDYLASIATPECAVITNSGTSHLETLKTKENIFLAKSEILNYLPKYAILPNEERFKNLKKEGIKSFYIADENCSIYDYKYTKNGIILSIKADGSIVKNIKMKTFYIHNLKNALFAYRVGKIYGLSDEKIKKGLEDFLPSKMREEYMKIKAIEVINDCYNSSYESVKSALYSLVNYSKMNAKTPSILIGDILEAGEESEEIHRRIGDLCKNLNVNVLAYGKYGKYVLEGANKGILFYSRDEISDEILARLSDKDVLLVKASRGMHFEKIIEEMKEKSNE